MKARKLTAALLAVLMVLACMAGCQPAAPAEPAPEAGAQEPSAVPVEPTPEATPAPEAAPAPETAPEPAPAPEAAAMTAGTYSVETVGFGGQFVVEVEVDEEKIVAITPAANNETPHVGGAAMTLLAESIVEKQSVNVDGISGASLSSNALKNAVKDVLAQAGADMDAFSVDYTTDPYKSTVALADFDQDIIAVGAGWAGMTAAITAAEQGAKVLLIEKTHHLGGAGSYSGGRIGGAGTKIQAAMGIEDNGKIYHDYLESLAAPFGTFNSEIVMAYAEASGESIDIAAEKWGFEFDPVPTFTYYPENVDRTYVSITQGFGATLKIQEQVKKQVEAGKIYVLRNTEATELIVKNGAVTGVVAGGERYLADGVILATGGYGGNEELMHIGFEKIGSTAVPTSDGSGILMAEAIGAHVVNMEYSKIDAGMVDLGSFVLQYVANVSYPGAIWVDIHGNRTVDETSLTEPNAKPLHWYNAEENTIFVVMTEAMLTDELPIFNIGGTTYNPDVGNKICRQLIEEGRGVYKADTAEELAEKMGVDPAAFSATLAQYSADAAAGKDSVFGRTEGLASFEEGPFLAFRRISSTLCTYGGIEINGNAEVIDVNGNVIPGLYAAGELTSPASFVGSYPFNGGFLGGALTFGRIAAESVVAALN